MDFVWFVLILTAGCVVWYYAAPVYDRVVAWLKTWIRK